MKTEILPAAKNVIPPSNLKTWLRAWAHGFSFFAMNAEVVRYPARDLLVLEWICKL